MTINSELIYYSSNSIALAAVGQLLWIAYPLMKRVTYWVYVFTYWAGWFQYKFRYCSLKTIICFFFSNFSNFLSLTNWFVLQPQAFLGIVHNWGATLGWAAVTGNLNDIHIFLPVHIAGICWTMVYDTIYAHLVWSFFISVYIIIIHKFNLLAYQNIWNHSKLNLW
jgi:4-hydroxybenzoate polyprenyltransferase